VLCVSHAQTSMSFKNGVWRIIMGLKKLLNPSDDDYWTSATKRNSDPANRYWVSKKTQEDSTLDFQTRKRDRMTDFFRSRRRAKITKMFLN
jgi:hypothetical protein